MKRHFSFFLYSIKHPIAAARQYFRKQIIVDDNALKSISYARDFHILNMNLARESTRKSGIKKISWICLPSSPEGGGISTISRFIRYFHEIGIPQEILVYTEQGWADIEFQRKVLYAHLGISRSIPIINFTSANRVDFVVATAWQTWASAVSLAPKERRMVFLQDRESMFDGLGDSELIFNLALQKFNYSLSFGPWLQSLAAENGIPYTQNFIAGVDEIYFTSPLPRKKELVVYYQPDKSRRLPGLAVNIAQIITKKLPDWNVLLVGSNSDPKLGGKIRSMGVLNKIELASLYRRASVGLVFSATNASLVPPEMASCGLHVISNNGPHVEWLDGESKSINFVSPEPKILIDSILHYALTSHKDIREQKFFPTWEVVIDDCIRGFVELYPKTEFSIFLNSYLK